MSPTFACSLATSQVSASRSRQRRAVGVPTMAQRQSCTDPAVGGKHPVGEVGDVESYRALVRVPLGQLG